MSSTFNASKGAKGHITNANPCWITTDLGGGNVNSGNSTMTQSLFLSGYGNNMRAEYVSNIVSTKFP